MSITAIFANSPFDKETRLDCKMLKMNTIKDGEICILENFHHSIFEIKDTIINVFTEPEAVKQFKVTDVCIAKFENNKFTCFGNIEEIS